MIKITILVENTTGELCNAEHGLSYYIQKDGASVLFDTGASNLFIKNAEKLGIDLNNVPNIVLSHGHYDHGDGLPYLASGKLICHPSVFQNRYRKRDGSYLGLCTAKHEAEKKFEMVYSSKPKEIIQDVWFLGEIKRQHKFEQFQSDFFLENNDDDPINDDTGMVINTSKGLILISGCAHSGICNMIDQAISITGKSNFITIIGGLHLKKVDDRLNKTIDFFKRRGISFINPSHCTSTQVIDFMENAVEVGRIKSGDTFTYES